MYLPFKPAVYAPQSLGESRSAGSVELIDSSKSNPIRFVVVGAAQLLQQLRVRRRKVLLGHGDPVSKPRCPPTVRSNRNDRVVAQRRNCHVLGGIPTPRVDDVRAENIPPTPFHIVAEDDELNARQTAGKISHGSVEVVRLGQSPTETLQAFIDVVATSSVYRYANEIEISPFFWNLRVQKATSLVDDVLLEGEVDTQLVLDVDEVPPRLKEDRQ